MNTARKTLTLLAIGAGALLLTRAIRDTNAELRRYDHMREMSGEGPFYKEIPAALRRMLKNERNTKGRTPMQEPFNPQQATGSAAEERLRQAEVAEQPETILDVRCDTGGERIRGAIRYDPKALVSAETLDLPFDKEERIALHVDSQDIAQAIEQRLQSAGFRSIRVIRDSIDDWRKTGGACERATG